MVSSVCQCSHAWTHVASSGATLVSATVLPTHGAAVMLISCCVQGASKVQQPQPPAMRHEGVERKVMPH